ncbi:amino acid ABC transporter substrate-binding protein [Methylobacterium sp. Leaf104]|uniref:branched-chain amino acid ABC transporter substrate-binding protein n=1 Tax=Methylobacterium TaxID=407 RepID=UPI0006FFD403|nr:MULTISPECIES: branched-chain amino acid ABC transporter substrate-binding protein [Methylobacterium]KQP42374.1 amino acid ABC transporter substrate-binding protein [Methylobacterium sp. Leaf104]MCI9879108.1 branched-chain amino acid ABC transporter substrate-binding protein [Methylobacterium goesingense]
MPSLRVTACALALAGLLMGSTAGSVEAQVRIGLSAPLTGPDAAFGEGLRLGAERAVADLNRAGGVNGQRLVLVVADDAGDGKQGLAVARRFAAERVGLVVGPFGAGVAALAVPVYEEAGIVAVTPGTGYPGLTAKGLWNVFRTVPNEAEQGRLAGAYLLGRHGGQRIGLVHDKSPFGRGLAEGVSRALKAAGQPEAAFETLTRGERDASGLAARLKRARVEVVYFGGLAPDAAMLLRGLRDAGVTAPLVGSDGLLDPAFPQAAGPAAEGTVMTLTPEPPRLSESKLPEPRLPDGKAAKVPRTPEANAVAAQAYAAVEILRQGILGAGSGDGRAVAAYLHQGRSLRTILGDLAYDARGDLKPDPRRPATILQAWKRTPDGRIDYVGNDVTP